MPGIEAGGSFVQEARGKFLESVNFDEHQSGFERLRQKKIVEQQDSLRGATAAKRKKRAAKNRDALQIAANVMFTIIVGILVGLAASGVYVLTDALRELRFYWTIETFHGSGVGSAFGYL